MSFLVLERPDQYLRTDLTPPEGFGTEWLAQYRDAKRDRDKEQRDARQERLAFVLKQWSQRRAWLSKRFVPLTHAQVKRTRGDEMSGMVIPPPPPPPPPPPLPPPPPAPEPGEPPVVTPPPIVAAPAAAAAAEERDAANIVVTGSVQRDLLPTAQEPPRLRSSSTWRT